MPTSPSIDELNQRFGVSGVASITAGNNGLPRVCVNIPPATAEIYLHGAQLTSWHPAGAGEVIFLSQHAQWEPGRAIRGGIPVCFPWFRNKADDPKAPAHGFVRTKAWQLDSVESKGDAALVSLSTASDAATRAWWPHDFHLTHRLTIGAELTQELIVSNTGNTPLRFEEALHTYYRVGGAEAVRVKGLDGVAYLDNTDGNTKKRQKGDIVFTGQTDSAYLDTTRAVEISDPLCAGASGWRSRIPAPPWSGIPGARGRNPWRTWVTNGGRWSASRPATFVISPSILRRENNTP